MVEIERFFPVASFPVASFPVALSKCKVLGFLATESVDVTAERFFPGGEISSSIPGVDRDERPVSEDEGVAVSLISEAAASEAEGDTMVGSKRLMVQSKQMLQACTAMKRLLVFVVGLGKRRRVCFVQARHVKCETIDLTHEE